MTSTAEALQFPERHLVVEHLVSIGWVLVNRKYGHQSPEPKPYHGPEHTVMVTRSAEALGEAAAMAGKIPYEKVDLLRIAAAYHDTVYQDSQPDNEEKSARIAVADMRQAGIFTDDEIQEVADIIMATKVVAVSHDQIWQSANARNYLTQLMADADLSSFGYPWEEYWPSAQSFFAELKPGEELAGENLKWFVDHQTKRLMGHKYYTEEAQRLFNNQHQNCERLQELLLAL